MSKFACQHHVIFGKNPKCARLLRIQELPVEKSNQELLTYSSWYQSEKNPTATLLLLVVHILQAKTPIFVASRDKSTFIVVCCHDRTCRRNNKLLLQQPATAKCYLDCSQVYSSVLQIPSNISDNHMTSRASLIIAMFDSTHEYYCSYVAPIQAFKKAQEPVHVIPSMVILLKCYFVTGYAYSSMNYERTEPCPQNIVFLGSDPQFLHFYRDRDVVEGGFRVFGVPCFYREEKITLGPNVEVERCFSSISFQDLLLWM